MNAIVLMAIGSRYEKTLHAVRDMFSEYAQHCHADLVVCENPPDPKFKRNLLCQKMLLPDLFRKYDWIAFMDLDILIARDAPSIFSYVEPHRAFSAVVDRRDSQKFQRVVTELWKMPSILQETHQSYFSNRGFQDHAFPKASVNGGVWLCKTSELAGALKEFYFSEFPTMIHEEAMMAYVAQGADQFFEMDYRFNTQMIYELFAKPQSPALSEVSTTRFGALKRFCIDHFPQPGMYPPHYRELADKMLHECYFLHFSSGFPFVNLPSEWTITRGKWPEEVSGAGDWSRKTWLAMQARESIAHLKQWLVGG